MSSIQANIIRQEGSSIILKTNPTIGIIALTAFVDNATPDIVNNTFTKTFRYSVNGVIYSEWVPLTLPNITSIALTEKKVFIAEINYTKNQPPGASYLDVTQATFTATDGVPADPKEYFDHSLFKKYFESDDIQVLIWYVNVLEKIYEKGLIPNYIDRLNDFDNPEDFLALWGSITKFFSFYVTLSKTFSQFYNNEELIREFLQQRGLKLSPEDTLAQLQFLLETYYYQMGQRGTIRIVTEGDILQAEEPNGELLRLIHYKQDVDEFFFNLYRKHHFGWNLGNCSPLHKGLRINDSLNKIPWSVGYVSVEDADAFTDGTIAVDGSIGEKAIGFTVGGGISFTGVNAIKIDHRLDYQISFKIKLTADTFSLRLIGYDEDNNVVNLKSRVTGANQNSFFSNAVLSRTDRYLLVKCYLYNSDRGLFAGDTTNIRQGQNLLSTSAVKKIGLVLDVETEGKVYDFRILPMQTEYSRGFLQANNFISTWVINRNGDYNIPQLRDYIAHYLIPYNCHIKPTNIGDVIYDDDQEGGDIFYWVGAGEYCRTVYWEGMTPSCETSDLIWVPEEETAYCEQ